MWLYVLVLLFSSTFGFEAHWDGYKDKFNKTYDKGENFRKLNWEKNVKKVLQHNSKAEQGIHTFTLRANHLADLTRADYLKMIGLKSSYKRKTEPSLSSVHHLTSGGEVPEELDWRKNGFVTPAWDQKTCGSCYAFSIAASVQAQEFRKKGKLEGLSQQQLVDCSIFTGNLGCSGGSFRNTMRYVELNGLMKEHDYPYEARQWICRYNPLKSDAKIKSWHVLPARDEEALKAAVAAVGPIPVALNASPHTFQLYHRGIYDDPDCPDDTLNHAMLLVGYTKDAWIVKNWWTNHWGQDGYLYLRRGKNRCGIANYAIVVTG